MSILYNEYLTGSERELEVIFAESEAQYAKLNVLFETVEAKREADMLAAEAKVLAENGTYDDLEMLYTEADKEANAKSGGIIKKFFQWVADTFAKISKWINEKLNKEADQLTQVAESLLQDGADSLFEQAKVSGDNQKIYNGIEGLFEKYNSTLKALRSASNTMTDFYRQTMMETAIESKESLSSVGITFAKDGTASVDIEKMKVTDLTTLENLFGSKSEFVNKIGFLSDRISNNAEANIESLSSAYNAGGNLYSLLNSSKYDFWGQRDQLR